jgi:acyl dehydratase
VNKELDLPEDFYFSARSRGRTITEADFTAMTNLTWTTSEIHTNREVAEEAHGGLLLAGGCIIGFALGLATPAILPEVAKRGIRLIALVGYDNVRFLSPLRPGDTIYIESKLKSIIRTSKPGRAVINFEDTLVDHHGREIARYIRSALCDFSGSVLMDAYSKPAVQVAD